MTDLATALLRDVRRHYDADALRVMLEADVLAALSRALDPALTERAGEVLPRLRKADEYEPLGHDGWEAADLITTLLAQNAALREQIRESALQELASLGQAQEAYEAQKAAEAKVERLRGALRELIDHTHNCERELTEELHKVDFCGESLPLTNARAALSTTTEEGHE